MVSQMYLFFTFTISLIFFTLNFVNCAPANAIEYNMNTKGSQSEKNDFTDSAQWNIHAKKNHINKRDYPTEGILLGRRNYPTEGILLGKREYPTEGILLGKKDYPTEGILLGRREYPTEGILLGKREYPTEGILLGKREYPTEGILLGKRKFPYFAPKSHEMTNDQLNN